MRMQRQRGVVSLFACWGKEVEILLGTKCRRDFDGDAEAKMQRRRCKVEKELLSFFVDQGVSRRSKYSRAQKEEGAWIGKDVEARL